MSQSALSADRPFPPGPPRARGPISAIVPAVGIFRDPIGFVSRRFDTYGDIYYVDNADNGLYVLRHPDHATDLLVTNGSKFRKTHSSSEQLSAFLGDALLTNEGEAWRRHRRMVGPLFHQSRLAGYAATMADACARTVAEWRDGEVRDMRREMMALTLRIVDRTLFGASEATQASDAEIVRASRAMNVAQGTLWMPGWLFSAYRGRIRRARAELDAIIDRRIAVKRRASSSRGDLLDALLGAVDAEGDGGTLSDAEVRDLLATFFMAGHETTALALTWTLYLLAQNPEARAELHAEVDSVLGARPVTYDDLPKLAHNRRVIQEAMRLYPPAYAVARRAGEDTRIGDYPVAAGSEAILWIYMMHRHPAIYPEPERFLPERFTPENEARRPKNAYLPFGGGARVCIGKAFAMVEAELALATLVRRFRFDLVSGEPVQAKPRITLGPRGGVRMRLVKR